MPIFALAEFWNDFYATGGFYVGVLSLIVGVLGFGYTIQQVRKTMAAAEAARLAAEATRAESRRRFQDYLVATASRLIGELRLLIAEDRWEGASFRVLDLSEALAQIGVDSPAIVEAVEGLRLLAPTLAKKARGERAQFSKRRWDQMIRQLDAVMDQLRRPLGRDGETR